MRDSRSFLLIALAIFLWSLFLALGVWLYAGDDGNRWVRPLVIVLVVDAFLGMWLLALFLRNRKKR